MATRISVTALPNGGQNVSEIEVPEAEVRRLDAMVGPPEESAARKRLEKLKSQRKPVIQPFEFEDETYHIRRLSYQQLIDLALSVSRDGVNALNFREDNSLRAVTIAVLMACVCCEDGEPFFAYEDAADYLDSPDEADLTSALFLECQLHNPDIFKTLKNG